MHFSGCFWMVLLRKPRLPESIWPNWPIQSSADPENCAAHGCAWLRFGMWLAGPSRSNANPFLPCSLMMLNVDHTISHHITPYGAKFWYISVQSQPDKLASFFWRPWWENRGLGEVLPYGSKMGDGGVSIHPWSVILGLNIIARQILVLNK